MFEQSPWIKSFIELNTNLRKQAKSDFETFRQDHGEPVQRISVNLVRAGENKKMRKLISRPLYAYHTIFNPNLVRIQMYKDSIKLMKPVYTGMCILDLGKTLMYDFYYSYLKDK